MSTSTRSSPSNLCVGSSQHRGLKHMDQSIDMNCNRCLRHPPPPPPSVDISVDNCGGGQMLSWWWPIGENLSLNPQRCEKPGSFPLLLGRPRLHLPKKKKSETRSELHKTVLKHVFLAWSEGIFPPVSTEESHLLSRFQGPDPERSQQVSLERKAKKQRLAQISVGSCRSEFPELLVCPLKLFLLDFITKSAEMSLLVCIPKKKRRKEKKSSIRLPNVWRKIKHVGSCMKLPLVMSLERVETFKNKLKSVGVGWKEVSLPALSFCFYYHNTAKSPTECLASWYLGFNPMCCWVPQVLSGWGIPKRPEPDIF